MRAGGGAGTAIEHPMPEPYSGQPPAVPVDPASTYRVPTLGLGGLVKVRRSLVAVVGLVALAATVPQANVAAQVPMQPNFVIIVTDDQRADTLHVMTDTGAWFETRGKKFPNAFATTPLCCPSRASIFTGRYAHNHKVRTNYDSSRLDQSTTLQYYLRNSGYRTGLFGKYLNDWKENPPHFDEWAVPQHRRYRNATWNIDGERSYVSTYSTQFIAAEARDFMSNAESLDIQPWMIFLTPQATHSPYTTEPQYRRTKFTWSPNPSVNEADVSDKPRYVRRMPRIKVRDAKRTRQRQLRTLLSVDDMVDSVFAHLDALGESENTYVFYLSDNGFAWGDHRLLSSGALKNTPYTGSVKLPFLMAGPGVQGAEDERLVANIDVAPTVMDLANVEASDDAPMDGRSLVADWERGWLLLEWWRASNRAGIPPWRSIRSVTAQYTEYRRLGRVVDREYYDLANDPFQLVNVLRDGKRRNDPELSEERAALKEFAKCSGSSCP